MSKRQATTLKRTAYHEAGHAVMALLLRRRFRYVTIQPDPERNSLGHILHAPLKTAHRELGLWVSHNSDGFPPFPFPHKPESTVRADVATQANRELLILLAGVAAETALAERERPEKKPERKPGWSFWIGQPDAHNAIEIARSITMSSRECDTYLDYLFLRARNLLNSPAYWNAVEKIAEALLADTRIGYRKATEIFKATLKANVEAAEQTAMLTVLSKFERTSSTKLI